MKKLFKRRDVFATITRVSNASNDWRVVATRGGRIVDETTAGDYAQARRFANYMVFEESRGTIDSLRRAWRNLSQRAERARCAMADLWTGIK